MTRLLTAPNPNWPRSVSSLVPIVATVTRGRSTSTAAASSVACGMGVPVTSAANLPARRAAACSVTAALTIVCTWKLLELGAVIRLSVVEVPEVTSSPYPAGTIIAPSIWLRRTWRRASSSSSMTMTSRPSAASRRLFRSAAAALSSRMTIPMRGVNPDPKTRPITRIRITGRISTKKMLLRSRNRSRTLLAATTNAFMIARPSSSPATYRCRRGRRQTRAPRRPPEGWCLPRRRPRGLGTHPSARSGE